MTDDLFECSSLMNHAYPDDINEWPEPHRLAAYAARDRLLAREPGVSVVSERSYCIDSSHERWPTEALPPHVTHALIYEVKLSSPIKGEQQ